MSKRNHIHLLFLSLLMSLGMGTIYAQNIDLESLGKGKPAIHTLFITLLLLTT